MSSEYQETFQCCQSFVSRVILTLNCEMEEGRKAEGRREGGGAGGGRCEIDETRGRNLEEKGRS